MANWQLNYGMNLNASGSDKLKCNLSTKGGNGVQLVMGGAIPDGPDGALDQVMADLAASVEGLDDLDAKDPKNHVKHLRAISAFCDGLAAAMGG